MKIMRILTLLHYICLEILYDDSTLESVQYMPKLRFKLPTTARPSTTSYKLIHTTYNSLSLGEPSREYLLYL